jgi:RNA polymerase primary sigma factor
MQSLAEQARIVRLPLNRVNGLSRILKTFSVLEQKFQREPTTEELAESIGVSTEEIVLNQKLNGKHVSVDAPFQDGEDNSLLDVLFDSGQDMPDTEMLFDSLKTEIMHALAKLTAREAEVINLYFGLDGEGPLTLEELGERFGLTRERVRQIKEKATRRIRYGSDSKSLKTYL